MSPTSSLDVSKRGTGDEYGPTHANNVSPPASFVNPRHATTSRVPRDKALAHYKKQWSCHRKGSFESFLTTYNHFMNKSYRYDGPSGGEITIGRMLARSGGCNIDTADYRAVAPCAE